MQTIIENVAVFGQFGGLIGIVSERADAAVGGEKPEARDLPAVIILNTGIIHRVGGGRLSTIWARRMARAGHCVLRFDLSGVGDSERRADNLTPTDGALADLRDAVDWLHSARGIRRIMMAGICWGADLSLLYAGTDPRICGLVIIDPSTPPTRRHYLRRCTNYLRKCMDFKLWKRKLQGLVAVLKSLRELPSRANPVGVWQYASLPLTDPRVHACVADAYRAAFARSVKMLAIFTDGADWYSYRNQLFDAFPEIDFDGNLRLEYFERCDHIITHEVNRARLFEAVDSWLANVEFKPIAAGELPQLAPAQSAAISSDLVSVEF